MDAYTGPSWSASPRSLYLISGIAALAVAVLLAIPAIFFGQSRFGFGAAAGILLLGGIPLVIAGVHTNRAYQSAKRLRGEGLSGQATVMGVGHSALEFGGHPMLLLDLLVRTEGRPDYRVRRREFVPKEEVGRLATGETLPVKLDPEDPSRLVIEWPRP